MHHNLFDAHFFWAFLVLLVPFHSIAQDHDHTEDILDTQGKKVSYYATMNAGDALALQAAHPQEIKIYATQNDVSAVELTAKGGNLLHHNVLVHGPGYIYMASKEEAMNSIGSTLLKENQNAQKQSFSYSIDQEAKVREALGLVNNRNIERDIKALENYGTRFHTYASAAQSVIDMKTKWEAIAANRSDISVRIVNHTSTSMPSVVLTIEGSTLPDEYVIIGGHIDSTNPRNNADAPGADDDASGIATITEAARVLINMDFKPQRTIEFMAYAAEEVGLRGSREIAEDYRQRNVNVVSYVQFDMTNYEGSNKQIYISADSYTDNTLNNFLRQLMDNYNSSGIHAFTYGTSACNYGCSDHYSWANQGYDVSFPFEASFRESNPNIHTNRDTYERSPTPNALHATRFAKLALEFLIEVAKSSDTGGGGCNAITSFPYTEGFESSTGNWTQSTQDDINWTRDSNGTPSRSTGPTRAKEGRFYLYTEASSPNNPNKRADLISSCIDLSSLSSATLSFAYHMRGSNMGTLSLQISENGGSTWSDLWEIDGDQGSTWKDAEIDLSAYSGEIKLRFSGVTGNGYRSDIAIDDLKIDEQNNRSANNDQARTSDEESALTRYLNAHEIETQEIGSFVLYANPTQDIAKILLKEHTEEVSIVVFSHEGKSIDAFSYKREGNQLIMNVSALMSGTYFVVLKSGTTANIQRLVKQ